MIVGHLKCTDKIASITTTLEWRSCRLPTAGAKRWESGNACVECETGIAFLALGLGSGYRDSNGIGIGIGIGFPFCSAPVEMTNRIDSGNHVTHCLVSHTHNSIIHHSQRFSERRFGFLATCIPGWHDFVPSTTTNWNRTAHGNLHQSSKILRRRMCCAGWPMWCFAAVEGGCGFTIVGWLRHAFHSSFGCQDPSTRTICDSKIAVPIEVPPPDTSCRRFESHWIGKPSQSVSLWVVVELQKKTNTRTEKRK